VWALAPVRARRTGGRLPVGACHTHALEEADVVAAQAFADVATIGIGILQHRAAIQAHMVVDQFNHALNSRIMIEQAKGILAERAGLD
jgi:hypothetical protein